MENFDKTLTEIRDLKIQGAARIAKAALMALAERLEKGVRSEQILMLKQRIFETRPNEPMMRNLISRYLLLLDQQTDVAENPAQKLADSLLEQLERDEKKIAQIGARLLHGKHTIFTHCHSSTVVQIVRVAVDSGEKLRVYCTETRPKFQGRTTAREMAEFGVEVIHVVDSAGLIALREADLFLLGADAILATGFFINKVGSGLLALASEWGGVPLFVASHTLKFDEDSSWGTDEEIEQRAATEVWAECPPGIQILNPAFEKIPTKYVEAFITEKGLLDLHGVQEAVRKG